MLEKINDLFDPLDQEAELLSDWQEDMMYDPEATEKFVKKSLCRHQEKSGIPLQTPAGDFRRKTVREFSQEPVSFAAVSAVLSSLRCFQENGKMRYFYPSAGGLYPIDIYVYVKEGRVNGISGGLYLYLPMQNALMPVSSEEIPARAHYFGNRSIFSSSAFSLYLVYDCESSMPKYNGMGLYYGILDAGIILGQITAACVAAHLGSCIIGDMNFSLIKEQFGLSENKVYLNCIEVGGCDA